MECTGLWFVQLYGCGWSSTTDAQFHGSKSAPGNLISEGSGCSQTVAAGRHLLRLRYLLRLRLGTEAHPKLYTILLTLSRDSSMIPGLLVEFAIPRLPLRATNAVCVIL
jgi:hypothetical protein